MREQGGGKLRKLYEALFAADASPVTQDQLLWRYVILQAIRDATSRPRSLKLMRRERKKRSIEWLTEGGEDFRNVCDLAGILPERVQTFAKYLLTQSPKGNTTMSKVKNSEKPEEMQAEDLAGIVAGETTETEEIEDADSEELEHHIHVPEGLLFHLDTRSAHDQLRDTILDFFKSPTVKRWSERSETEQRSLATEISCAVKKMIAQTAQAVATHGFTCLPGRVEQMTVKKGIKLVIESALSHKNFEAAGEMQGRYVTIINTSFEDFTKTLEEAVLDKDQPSLPLSDGQKKSVAEAAAEIIQQNEEEQQKELEDA